MTITELHGWNDETEKQGRAEVHGGDWASSFWSGTVALANDDQRTIHHYFQEQLGEQADDYFLIGFNVSIHEHESFQVKFLAWRNRDDKTIWEALNEGDGKLRVESFTTKYMYRADGWEFLRTYFRDMQIRAERYIVDQGVGPESEREGRVILGYSDGENLLITKDTDLEQLQREREAAEEE